MTDCTDEMAIEFTMRFIKGTRSFEFMDEDLKICPVELMLRQICEIKHEDSGFTITEVGAYSLGKSALEYRQAYDLAKRVAASYLQHGRAVPKGLEKVVSYMLYDFEPPPKLTGYVSGKIFMRNVGIFKAVEFLNTVMKIKPTFNYNRSQNSKASKSGCECVAEACNRLGYRMITPDAVLKIWKDKNIRAQIETLNL